MITALDTSVILDVVTHDEIHAMRSMAAIRKASSMGALVICECVLAEIRPALPHPELEALLLEWRLSFSPSTKESALIAGAMFEDYLNRSRNVARRVFPDFLIGAHALVNCDRLLARDRGYYRDYFEGLHLIEP